MADYTPAGATWDPNTNSWVAAPQAGQWQGGQVGKVGTGDVGAWLAGPVSDALSGHTRARAHAYDPARIDAAQQPWLSSLATAAGETPELAAQQAMASDRERLLAEAAGINPTATRDRLVGVGDQFGADARRQAGGIEGLATEFGAAPSYAEEASRAAMDRASAEANARAASARGPNAALQLREAAGMNAGAARMAASEAGAMKAKEMSDRFGQRAGMLSQAAGVTAAGATGQGQLYDAAGGAELAARGARADMTQGASSLAEASGQLGLAGQQNRTGAASAGGQIATSGQTIAAGSHDATMASNMDTNRQNSANRQKSTSGLLQAGAGMLAMMSDIRAKDGVEPMDDAGLKDAMARYEARGAGRAPASSGGDSSEFGQGMMMQGLSMLSDREAKRDAKLAGKLELLAALDEGEGRAIRAMDAPPKRSMLAMAADPDVNREALAPVKPYTFRYRPEAAAAMGTDTEPRPGIMAQDLERSPVGRDVVSEGEGGMKELDIRKAVGFSLAANAGMDKRVARLERLKRAAGER